MARLAIDLGNCSTKLTLDRKRVDGSHLLPGLGGEVHNAPWTVLVPSLIQFGVEELLGEEVNRAGLVGDPATFRDFNDHLRHPLPAVRAVQGRSVGSEHAAEAFLSGLVERVRGAIDEELDVVLIAPWSRDGVCRRWLRSVRVPAARSLAVLDKDTALVLGNGTGGFTRGPVLVFDFGFSAIRARVVQASWYGRDSYTEPEERASVEVACGLADLKLDALRRCSDALAEQGVPAGEVEGRLFLDVARDWIGGSELGGALDVHRAREQARRALEMVLEEASLHGVRAEDVAGVFLCGGGAALAPVRTLLGERFGDRVTVDPFSLATGRGGLAFLADSPMDDMVWGHYALRMRDPITGEYHYPTIVERFTRFPTRQPTARFIVNTFYDGQTAVDLEVYRSADAEGGSAMLEVLFDADGRPGFSQIGERRVYERAMETPLVIPVDPPGRIGERRLHLEFHVDTRKHLLLSVKDLREERVIYQDQSVLSLA
jgi:hypothetical protein